MEREDEEFEQLLGEIPQAMASSEGLESGAVNLGIPTENPVGQSVGKDFSPLLDSEDFFHVFQSVPGDISQGEAVQRLSPTYPVTSSVESPMVSDQSKTNGVYHRETAPLSSLGFTESSDALQVPLDVAFGDMDLNDLKDISLVSVNKTDIGGGMLKEKDPGILMDEATAGAFYAAGARAAKDVVTSEVPHSSTPVSMASQSMPCDGLYHSNINAGFAVETLRGRSPEGISLSNGNAFKNSLGMTASAYADGLISLDPKAVKPRGVPQSDGLGQNKYPNFPMEFGLDLDKEMHYQSQLSGTMKMHGLPSGFRDSHLHPDIAGNGSFASGIGLHRNSSISNYIQVQQAYLAYQRREEERQQKMRQYLLQQQTSLGCLPSHLGSTYTGGFPPAYLNRDQIFSPQLMTPSDWRFHVWQHDGALRYSSDELIPQPQSLCSMGERYTSLHSQIKNSVQSMPLAKVLQGRNTLVQHDDKQPFAPVRILSRKNSRGISDSTTPTSANWLNKAKMNSSDINGHTELPSLVQNPQDVKETRKSSSSPNKSESEKGDMQPQLKYNSLAEIEGHIFSVAKDQHGCRFLQRKFDEGVLEDVEKIFSEIINHAVELMVDPFGNYLIQKLLEVCTENQRLDILKSVTNKGELINVSLNLHGTRAVQKLIETLESSQQVSIVTAALKPGVVTLIKDLNGNHVIQRCLQHLSSEDNQFIFEAAAYNCVEIATHRHGCCVLQRCIDYSTGVARQRLISEVAANSLLLSQDPFGNYVVQYVLELDQTWACEDIMDRLSGNYAHLSMQKFSSNVVEKCLKLAGEEWRTRIIEELMDSSHIYQLLQDPFANYVIQSALAVSKGSLHTSLVEAIRPYVRTLRSSPYGKRILSRKNLKKC